MADIMTDILVDIRTDILADIRIKILADIRTDTLADIRIDILPDIRIGILADIKTGILSDIRTDILTDISFDILTDISAKAGLATKSVVSGHLPILPYLQHTIIPQSGFLKFRLSISGKLYFLGEGVDSSAVHKFCGNATNSFYIELK